ncbi:MAG: thioredoxin domain-containing protein, partial [Proteobacteria bacterium]
MLRRMSYLILLLCLSSLPYVETSAKAAEGKKGGIAWVDWTPDLFQKAQKEKRLVILDLEAIWCHWCHVMEKQTYADPKVRELIQKHFIAVRVDQDARPDLSQRYEDYGWPATILFAPDGTEIAKRAGYIPPNEMNKLLKAFIDDPTPGPSIVKEEKVIIPSSPLLSPSARAQQEKLFLENYDKNQGSWGTGHKFLEWNAVELALRKAAAGDLNAEQMAKKTLDNQRALIDPVWGGVYQYSTSGVWTEPHFEKIMQFQAENLRIYALAYSEFGNVLDKESVQNIARFLTGFLQSPEGAFYTSQDADVIKGKHSESYFNLNDADRRKQGIPTVDKNIYSRENGWAIVGFTSAYAALKDDAYLEIALKSANWILKERSLPQGGFKHGDKDRSGPFLGDTLAMGHAFLSLYAVTAKMGWLKKAEEAASFIEAHFKSPEGGYLINRDDNITMVRFTNLLYQYTGKSLHKAMTEHAMRYVASPQVSSRFAMGILLADAEIARAPVHITVVGKKSDPAALSLFRSAIAYPDYYKRIDWFD